MLTAKRTAPAVSNVEVQAAASRLGGHIRNGLGCIAVGKSERNGKPRDGAADFDWSDEPAVEKFGVGKPALDDAHPCPTGDPDFDWMEPESASSRSTLDYGEATLTFEIVKVTPAIARAWLKWNVKNRPLTTAAVDRYAKIMAEGRWKLNGEPIIFASNGQLQNGQHRLTACIVSGASFTTLVVRGISPDVFDTLDNGKIRTGASILAMEGFAQTHVLSGAALLLMLHRAGLLGKNRTGFVGEPAKIRQTVAENPGLVDSIKASAACHKICPGTITAFCHYLFHKQDPELAERFFRSLATGLELLATDPIYHLRNRLIQNKASNAKLRREMIIALIIKAWNYTREGRKINLLRFAPDGKAAEEFPTIDG